MHVPASHPHSNPGSPDEHGYVDHRQELDTMAARLWLRASTPKLIFITIGFAAMVFLIAFGFDMLLVREHESRRAIFALSDLLTSALTALLFFLYGMARRREFARRLETIADMNHHIRNALQVISASHYITDRKREVAAIEEAVTRIQWALREILPKL